jgi:hypothetical protein
MDSRIADVKAALKSSKHEIRGTQLAADDIDCFGERACLKVPGAVINVVGALLQGLGEKDGLGDFAVFSTWLSPLISRKVMQGKSYGTIAGHIEDTVNSFGVPLAATNMSVVPGAIKRSTPCQRPMAIPPFWE